MNFCPNCGADMRNIRANRGLHGKWEPLGHRIGIGKHPHSEEYRCSLCGYEAYTVYSGEKSVYEALNDVTEALGDHKYLGENIVEAPMMTACAAWQMMKS